MYMTARLDFSICCDLGIKLGSSTALFCWMSSVFFFRGLLTCTLFRPGGWIGS